ncbi:MAG: DUF5696 domain-containing protein [Bacillota bacterium]
MSNLFKRILIVTAFALSGIAFLSAQTNTSSEEAPSLDEYYNYIEDEKLKSSLYSKTEDDRALDPDTFIAIDETDELVEKNDSMALYLNADTMNFKVKNLATDYVYSTAMEESDAGNYTGLLSGGIGIEYIDKERNMRVNENVGITETEFTVDETPIENGVRLDIFVGGYCSTSNCERLYEDYVEGVYTKEQMAQLGLSALDLSFALEVTLTDEGIKAHIPHDSIEEEETEKTALSSIILFPSMGATRMDETPGYMVIPDGAGTLIRYEDNEGQYGSPFEERFYGSNRGLPSSRTSVTSHPLSMPIFGAVHGINQNGFVGIIESGDVNARLMAYPNGASNLDYNLIFTKFDLRQTYRQSFTSDGSGGAQRTADALASDITVRYDLLEDEAADYVGVAKAYRTYLKTTGSLKQAAFEEDAIPMHMQYLMSDSLNRFWGESVVGMSSVEAVESMYLDLMDRGIRHQTVSLMGWNDGGYSGNLPSKPSFENKLGSQGDYDALIERINENNDVYLLNDFIGATEATQNINYRNDIAQGVDRFQLEWECEECVYTNRYSLYPESSKRLALDYRRDFTDQNTNILFESIGSDAFSYYDNALYMREDALAHYREIMEAYEGNSAYIYPNAYAYPYTETFFHAPIFNSQLKYYDDLVPLLQIVLRGSMDLYGDFMNFNSLGQEQMLMMIDFGMNPAYIVSEKRSSELRGTDIERYFSTHYDKWNESIVDHYDYMNQALKHVIGETIESRTVLEQGVVETTYSNGVSIVINYTSQSFDHEDGTVPSLDYMVRGVS